MRSCPYSAPIASTHEDRIRSLTRAYNERHLDGFVDQFSEYAEMRTLLLGTIQGREAIRAMIRRQWEEVDPRFEVHDIQDVGERQAIGTATFIITTEGMEQRQALAYLFTFGGGDKQTLDAIEIFRTPEEAWKAASTET